jgi:hypothetical protein
MAVYRNRFSTASLGGKMKHLKLLFICSLITLGSGCASNRYSVTYDSNPQGAEVFCNGQSHGYTPVTLYYTLNEQTKKNGVLRTLPCDVKWVSGASGSLNTVFDLKQFPNGVITTTSRPDVPNAHIDHSFALQLKQNQLIRKQQQDQASAELGYAIGCALGGGCANSSSTRSYRSTASSVQNSSTGRTNSGVTGTRMCPDGTYVAGSQSCQMAPDGTFVTGGSGTRMCPDGTYVSGTQSCILTPNGTYVGGGRGTTMCPDGTIVAGSRCQMTPDGKYVGVDK